MLRLSAAVMALALAGAPSVTFAKGGGGGGSSSGGGGAGSGHSASSTSTGGGSGKSDATGVISQGNTTKMGTAMTSALKASGKPSNASPLASARPPERP